MATNTVKIISIAICWLAKLASWTSQAKVRPPAAIEKSIKTGTRNKRFLVMSAKMEQSAAVKKKLAKSAI